MRALWAASRRVVGSGPVHDGTETDSARAIEEGLIAFLRAEIACDLVL